PIGQLLPGLAGVERARHGELPVVDGAAVAGIDGNHIEAVRIVRVGGGREAEVRGQPLGDLRPTRPGVAAAVDTDVGLRVHAVGVRGGEDDLVDAVAPGWVLQWRV